MSEVVFQKGLSHFIAQHRDELKFELRDECYDEAKEECAAQLAQQREFFNQRFSIANAKSDALAKEKETLKLQIVYSAQQMQKVQSDNDLRYEKWEEMSGKYEKLMSQYLILKKEYRELEESKFANSKSTTHEKIKEKKKKKKNKKSNLP